MVPFDLERERFMNNMFVCRILYFLGLISTSSVIEDWKYYMISVRGKNFQYKQIQLVNFDIHIVYYLKCYRLLIIFINLRGN